MKRGTASRVFLGGNKVNDDFGGLLLLSQVVLGKKSGMFTDHTGLYITDNVMLGKGIARVITAVVHGTSPLSLPDAIANSLQYVKAFGGTELRKLPSGYTQVAYIYFLASSYLTTNINPSYDGRYEFDFQTTTLGSGGATTYLGVRPSSSGSGGLRVARISLQVFRIYGFGAYQDSTITAASNTRYKFVWDNQHAVMTSGGSTVLDLTYTGTDACAYPITINGWNSAGTVTPGSEDIFVYSFKAWNAQGELVADYVPTKDPDGVVGFYDMVSESFKTATAGTIAAGPDAAPIPTPDAPVDIVCNNGALKARHQSGLPLGYTLVDGITANGTQYIDTGIKIASTDTVETEFKNSTSTGYDAVYGIYATGESSAFYANQTYYGYDESNNKVNTNVAVDDQWHTVVHDFVNGTLQLDDTTVTFTPFVFANANNNGLFTRFYNGSYGYFFKGSVKSHKITRNGTVIFNAVSVQRDSDSALGMYDFVSGTFFENDGTGDFTAGIAVSDPVEVYANSTVETIEDTIGNTATAEMLLKVGDYQDVQSILDGVVMRNVGVKVLDGTEDWAFRNQSLSLFYATIADTYFNDNQANHLALSTHFLGVEVNNPSMPDNSCKCASLTGTNSLQVFVKSTNFAAPEDIKSWFAAQYAAGTPVIVVYPFATPTTESVAGQTLQVQAGDNTLEITQASMNGLELEAQYTKVA